MNSPRKTCTRCKVQKSLGDFSIDKTRSDGLSKWCKECVRENGRAHYAANRDRIRDQQAARRQSDPERVRQIGRESYARNREKRIAYNKARYEANKEKILLRSKEWHRFRRFGLTADAFAALLAEQGNRCAICGTEQAARWTVDHDRACCPTIYTCGKCIRGILCHPCNAGIGLLRDDPALCRSAADYLDRGPISPST